MFIEFREEIVSTLKKYFESQIEKHKLNIDVLMYKGVGVAEHPGTMETIEKELEQIANYNDKLDVLLKYFEEVN